MGKTTKKLREKRGRELQKEVEKLRDSAHTEEEVGKLKDEELFEITEKSKNIRKQRYPLDPQRFKRKMWKFLGKSKNEAKLVSKLAKKLRPSQPAPKPHKEAELMDLWGTSEPNRVTKRKMEAVRPEYPAVVIPHAGQSYNPAASDYKVGEKK